jgi:hypothetical protein
MMSEWFQANWIVLQNMFIGIVLKDFGYGSGEWDGQRGNHGEEAPGALTTRTGF